MKIGMKRKRKTGNKIDRKPGSKHNTGTEGKARESKVRRRN